MPLAEDLFDMGVCKYIFILFIASIFFLSVT